MRRFSANRKYIGIFAIGLVVGLLAAACWTTIRPRSPLTANLSWNWQESSARFDARVRDRFPLGTPISRFTADLGAEGFKPTWYEIGGEYSAVRDESNVVCNIAARVYWRVGKNDTLAAIRGLYREEGCL